MSAGATVDPTIRNLRYDRWRRILILGFLAAGWLAVLVYVAVAGMHPFHRLGFAVLTMTAAGCSLVFVMVLPWVNPVARLKLGDDLEVNPGAWHYPPARIREIAFARDPAEDYHDFAALPIPTCEVRIQHWRRGTFRLVVSAADAERLRAWAIAKGVPVCDGDGYRPRASEPSREV